MWDEWCGKREDERLVGLRSLLGKSHGRWHADGQVVSTNKVGFGLLNNAPVLLQVFNLVAVRRGEIGAHAAVVTSDDDTTSAGGLLGVVEVVDIKASLLVGGLEGLGVLVLADTSKVDDRLGWEDVLRLKSPCQF